jgi:hypothetical protein
MTPELQTLARRAVACKGWRWVPGMAVADAFGWRRGLVVDIAPLPEPGAWVANRAGVSWLSAEELGRCLPDLSDPGTLGCLLALVREAIGCPEAHVYYADLSRLWVVRWGHEGLGVRTVDASTEAEALVAALEAAPCD